MSNLRERVDRPPGLIAMSGSWIGQGSRVVGWPSIRKKALSSTKYFGARYYASTMGRFLSPNPAGIMKQKLYDPQQWNMYEYAVNNPLTTVDHNGKWPTKIHEDLIDKAFPGLSAHQRGVLKSSSYWMDHCASCQLERNSYQHYMRDPNQSPADAKAAANKFIAGKEHQAQTLEKGTPTSASAISDKSLSTFGDAAHTVADSTSPAHVDAQGDPRPWGIYTTVTLPGVGTVPMIDQAAIDQHESEETESALTPERQAAAVSALQQAFKDTYGSAATDQAIKPPSNQCSNQPCK